MRAQTTARRVCLEILGPRRSCVNGGWGMSASMIGSERRCRLQASRRHRACAASGRHGDVSGARPPSQANEAPSWTRETTDHRLVTLHSDRRPLLVGLLQLLWFILFVIKPLVSRRNRQHRDALVDLKCTQPRPKIPVWQKKENSEAQLRARRLKRSNYVAVTHDITVTHTLINMSRYGFTKNF